MIRNTLHILLAAMVSLTPPGASMVQFTCDLTGATTQVVNALGAANHVDDCCDAPSSDHALSAADCCRATAFSLPPTSPAPVHTDATPALACLDIVRPDTMTRAVGMRAARLASPPLSRTLPLQI
ncbi:MAG TPA: hypothetical protein VF247_03880 [Candidatus Krumholzibacteria bacterium]